MFFAEMDAARALAPRTELERMMYALSLWPFTLIHSLLFVAGVCAWAVWASRQPDAQSELVEQLTAKKKK